MLTEGGDPGAMNGARVAGVVIDHNSGPVLAECVRSLLDEGVTDLVVIENGDHSGALRQLAAAGLDVPVIHSGRNLGYGAGANRGVAATVHDGATTEYVLVCNPDLNVHRGAVASMAHALGVNPAWAVIGPRILTPEGEPYPSVRPFPSVLDAAMHAIVGLVKEDNRFTRRYRPAPPSSAGPTTADWVSGACFMARRQAFEEIGGFDERYFMFAEDMDLCYRLHQAGWGVGFQPDATVTHVQGVSTRRHPYRMLLAHHRSALRFSVRTTTGWRRVLLPAAALILGARLAAAVTAEAAGRLGTPKN